MMVLMVKVALLYWREDPAGRGISVAIRDLLNEYGELSGKVSLVELGKNPLTITQDDVDSLGINIDSHIVVLSKHSSESGRPSLTVHPAGNPSNDAALGGSPRRLSYSTPLLMKLLLSMLFKKVSGSNITGFYVGLEATHHGPTDLDNPLCFIEIGSTPEMWVRVDLHRLVGEAVMGALNDFLSISKQSCVVVASFGENHYPARLTRRVIESNICVSHIIARYALKNLDEGIVQQALTKSVPPASMVFIEKNSVSRASENVILAKAKELGIKIEYY